MADHPTPAKAVELSKKEAQAIAKQGHELEREIRRSVKNANAAYWELAELLYQFHEGGYWTFLGYETLDEFLAQPEIGISRNAFFRATRLHRDLRVQRKVPARVLKSLEPTKVREVHPAIMRGEVKVEDAFDDAKQLASRDLAKKYRRNPDTGKTDSGQEPDDSTPLDASSEPEAVRCKGCGNYWTPPPYYEEGAVLSAQEVEVVKHWGAAAYRAAEAGTNALTEEERNLIIRLTGTDTPDVVEADAKEKK